MSTTPASSSPAASVKASSALRRSARTPLSRPITSDHVFSESPVLAGAPLGPLCDRRSIEVAPLDEPHSYAPLCRVELDDRVTGWTLRHRDGMLVSPACGPEDEVVVQTPVAMDVYFGLLALLHKAGLPESGRVRVNRLRFLRMIRWDDSSGVVGGPAYTQLRAALNYLADLRIHSTTLEPFLVGDDEPGSKGTLTFRILQAWGSASSALEALYTDDDLPGVSDDLIVYFSTPFVRLLVASEARVTYRLSHYLSFRRGAPRALYRYISYLATQPMTNGVITVDLDEVLSSLGSTLRGVPPAKFRQLVRDTPEALCSMGLLRQMPQFSRIRDGERLKHRVAFRPQVPVTPATEALLLETLIAWGVQSTTASKLVQERTETVAMVVAATVLGMLRVRKSLPAMVVDYCTNASRVLNEAEMPRFQAVQGEHSRTTLSGREMEYLAESLDDDVVYLRGLDRETRERLRAQYTGINREAWIVDGLVYAAARQARAGWSLKAFLRGSHRK